MQIYPRRSSFTVLDTQRILTLLTTSIREGVVFSIERKEECRFTISFALKSCEISVKRTGFSKRIIDSRSASPAIETLTLPEISALQRIKEASSKIAKFLDRHCDRISADEHMTLTIAFVMGKVTSMSLNFEVRFKGEVNG